MQCNIMQYSQRRAPLWLEADSIGGKGRNSESGEETRHGFPLIFKKSSYFIQSELHSVKVIPLARSWFSCFSNLFPPKRPYPIPWELVNCRRRFLVWPLTPSTSNLLSNSITDMTRMTYSQHFRQAQQKSVLLCTKRSIDALLYSFVSNSLFNYFKLKM